MLIYHISFLLYPYYRMNAQKHTRTYKYSLAIHTDR